jgi:hypothetical protein
VPSHPMTNVFTHVRRLADRGVRTTKVASKAAMFLWVTCSLAVKSDMTGARSMSLLMAALVVTTISFVHRNRLVGQTSRVLAPIQVRRQQRRAIVIRPEESR